MCSPYLSRSRILATADLKVVEEPVPEWPNTDGSPGLVRLRQLSAEESMSLAWEMMEGSAEDGLYILLVRSAIDEESRPLFTMADIPQLRRKSLQVLDRLQRRCLELNSLPDWETGAAEGFHDEGRVAAGPDVHGSVDGPDPSMHVKRSDI